MALPYTWMQIRANGPLPSPSMVGPSSPYWRIQPFSGISGPASAWPQAGVAGQQLALNAGTAETAAPNLVRQALNPGNAALAAGPRVFSAGPAGIVDDAAAAGIRGTAGGVSRSAAPGLIGRGVAAAAAEAPVAEAAASTAARSGLLNTARTALGLGGGEGAAGALGLGARLTRGGLYGAPLVIGGNMLDESNWLGGSESAANDYTSKALKWGGLGAGIGTMITPGVGTAIGAGVGGLVGLAHEGLERGGVLKAPTIQEKIDTTIHGADQAARSIGLPEEVISTLKQQYQAQRAFIDPGDKANRTMLAEEYAARLQEQAQAFAADPNAFLRSSTSSNNGGGDATQRAMLMRQILVDAVKPYADNYLAQSEATAQSLENMAGSAGELAPMYQQQAASTRQMGGMYAANLINQAQVTPYMQALQDQAGYLNSLSSNLMQQAMSQVMQPQQAAAGSTDITSIIDQYANAAQPN